MTIDDMVLGLITLALPLLVIGFLALRRMPAIFAFFVAMLAVGLGYLTTTGTVDEVGGKVRAHVPAGMLPAPISVKVDITPPAMPAALAPATPPAAQPEPTSPPAATPPAPANQ